MKISKMKILKTVSIKTYWKKVTNRYSTISVQGILMIIIIIIIIIIIMIMVIIIIIIMIMVIIITII